MITLLGVLGTQELLIMIPFALLVLAIPFLAYFIGKKRGRIQGRLEEIEKQRKY